MKPIYKWLAAASGMLFLGFMVWYFHTILFYIITAVVVALIGKPVFNLLSKIDIKGRKMPAWLKSALTLLLLGGAFLMLVFALIPIVVEKLQVLSNFDMAHLDEVLQGTVAGVEESVNNLFPSAHFSLHEVMMNQLEPFFSSGVIKQILNSFTSIIMDLGMAIFSVSFISFFFIKDEGLFSESVVTVFPKRYEDNIKRAITSITNLLIRYFIGICTESLIKFICVSIPVYLIGFDWGTAVMIGLITAVLNVIPYIGPIIGALISFMIAAITPVEGVVTTNLLIQIGGILLVFQLLDNMILQPYIYSSSVKAHPLEIFIVILMAGYIAGVVGMLLAIPAYTVLRVIAKEFFNNMRVVQKLTENI